MAQEINKNNFNQEIGQYQGVALVDFWAPWCQPCKMLGPTIDALANKYEGKAKVAKVNVDESNDIAMRYGIRSIPTVLILKDGQVVESLVGVQPQEVYEQKLNALQNS